MSTSTHGHIAGSCSQFWTQIKAWLRGKDRQNLCKRCCWPSELLVPIRSLSLSRHCRNATTYHPDAGGPLANAALFRNEMTHVYVQLWGCG
jgi:hypothetical protein